MQKLFSELDINNLIKIKVHKAYQQISIVFHNFKRKKTRLFVWELSTKSGALEKYADVRSSQKSHSALITSLHWQFFGLGFFFLKKMT